MDDALLSPAPGFQSFLASGFLVVGILFAFHLKGSDLEQRIHLMLVFIIFMTVIFSYLEIRYPESALLSLARAAIVFFQGTWFCEIGHVLFSGECLLLQQLLAAVCCSSCCCNCFRCCCCCCCCSRTCCCTVG